MLGIYAPHLLTLTADPDLALFREVLSNLRLLLGDHPDVVAIDLWLNSEAKAAPFRSPPMLRNSWRILVKSSRKDEGLVPTGSYSLRISDRLWGSGCWLVWQTPPPAEAVPLAKPVNLQIVLDYSSNQLRSKTASQFVREQVETKNLTGLESSMLAYIASMAQNKNFVVDLRSNLDKIGWLGPLNNLARKLFPSDLEQMAKKTVQGLLSKESVAQNLGIPMAGITAACANLSQKLGLK